MYYDIFIKFIPFIFFIGYYLTYGSKNNIHPISQRMTLFFVIIMAICMGMYPTIEFTDKYNYEKLYFTLYFNVPWIEFKDAGWQGFVWGCTKIFGENSDLFFLFVSFVYAISYYIFGIHHFGKKYCGYFTIMAFGCLAFIGYGINTIRSGFALALLLLALSLEKKTYIKALLAFLAIKIHLSMAIPVMFFIIAFFIKKNKYIYIIWLVCFILSYMNISFASAVEDFIPMDERLYRYTNNIGGSSYKTGFRMDFIIYSVIPILIAYYYTKKAQAKSSLYHQIYRTYILANAFWLLVIRMTYTDRMAYLSWFLIPYIVLYPIISNYENIKHSQKIAFKIMALFMTFNILLSLRGLF